MAHRIVMPSFGMYTAEGTLGRWLRPAGSRVEAGEPIADLVTEKATYELESPASGLLHPVAVEGENLQVEGLIGWILEEGEAAPESAPQAGEAAAISATANAATTRDPNEGERLRAAPLARRIAVETGIDLATLVGTGPGGRIVEADVRAASRPGGFRSSAAPKPETPWRVRERIPLLGARKTIGERLRRTLDQAVSLTLTREVRAEALVAASELLPAQLGTESLTTPSSSSSSPTLSESGPPSTR